MYNKVRTGERVKVEHVVTVLEKKYPYVEVNSILGIDSAYDQNRKVNILWCFSSDCNTMLSLPPLLLKVKVTQSCLTLCDPMGYTVHGLLQARTLEWVACPFSRGSSQPRTWTMISCIVGGFFTNWPIRISTNIGGGGEIFRYLPFKKFRNQITFLSLQI